MFLLAAVALALITVPLAGGRLARLAEIRFRWVPLILLALVVQVVIMVLVPGGNDALHRLLHIGSYGLAGVFLLVNHRQAGIRVLATGALLNAAAIAANNGVMPASASALRVAGELRTTDGFANSTALAHRRLLFLGDVFAIPKSIPLHNVFSIGDVLIALGAAIAIHTATESRLAPRRLSRELRASRTGFMAKVGSKGPNWPGCGTPGEYAASDRAATGRCAICWTLSTGLRARSERSFLSVAKRALARRGCSTSSPLGPRMPTWCGESAARALPTRSWTDVLGMIQLGLGRRLHDRHCRRRGRCRLRTRAAMHDGVLRRRCQR